MFWNVDERILEYKQRPGQCTGRKNGFTVVVVLPIFLNGHLKTLNINRLVAWPLLADIRTLVFSPLAGIFLPVPIFLTFSFWSFSHVNGGDSRSPLGLWRGGVAVSHSV